MSKIKLALHVFLSLFFFFPLRLMSANENFHDVDYYRSIDFVFILSDGLIVNASFSGSETVGRTQDRPCQYHVDNILGNFWVPVSLPTIIKPANVVNPKELSTTGYMRFGGYCQWGSDAYFTSQFKVKMPFDGAYVEFHFNFWPQQDIPTSKINISNTIVMNYGDFYVLPKCSIIQPYTSSQNGKVKCLIRKTADYDHTIKVITNYGRIDVNLSAPQIDPLNNMKYDVEILFVDETKTEIPVQSPKGACDRHAR